MSIAKLPYCPLPNCGRRPIAYCQIAVAVYCKGFPIAKLPYYLIAVTDQFPNLYMLNARDCLLPYCPLPNCLIAKLRSQTNCQIAKLRSQTNCLIAKMRS
ncbi:MAG: hypothetical protein KA767_03910 [Saprospiraceae bacterium]|nr:hypothetical protein [Saprospiraceae bacterium]